MKHRRFTNTALPVFSGAECWFQHSHIVQAIVKSNGWPEETAALQLFAHLKGEALNVALLLTKEKRESWTGLVSGLSAYYQSPSRLADLRRRFESTFRQPGLDSATFATDLGILAIQGFEDMKKQARDTMIRDKFIAGQEQCALRRQLGGFAQDTPIGEIVDSCRVWESHSDSNRVSTVNCDSDVGSQPSDISDSGTKEIGGGYRKTGTEGQKPGGRWWTRYTGRPVAPIDAGGDSEERSTTDRGAGVLFLWRRLSQGQPMPASEHGLPSFTAGWFVES